MPYTKKMREKMEPFRFAGTFTEAEAKAKGMRLVIGSEKNVRLYWLVDESDGVIADAKFQAFGPPALLVIGEIASELVLRKNYHQASRISADLLDHQVRDKKESPAFPPEAHPFLNHVLVAIDEAVEQCSDIAIADAGYDVTPIERDFEPIEGGIPGWEALSRDQKVHLIEQVIDREIRPYVELDAGGVKVVDLKENGELLISYEGSCTTCHSATGSTLSAIQHILKARIHPSLTVIPQL